MNTRTRLAMTCLATVAALTAAGCGGSGGGVALGPSTTSAAPTTSATPTSVPPAPADTQSAGGGQQPGQPAPAEQRCHTSDLTGHVEQPGAGMGQRYAVLGLTNRTAKVCRVYGYPGLQLFDAQGRAMPTTAVRDQAVTPTTVEVSPGQTVWTRLQWTVVNAADEPADCAPNPTTLKVIPPDETTQLSMPFDLGPVCQHGRMVVGPFGSDPHPMG